MKSFTRFLAAASAIGGLSAPLAAQNPYPYPQQGYPQQSYPYPSQQYGYGQQGYGNPVTDIIDSLLGNRYNVTDRQAIRQCANAARAQASGQYGGYGYNNGYGNRYHQGIAAPSVRVTAITDVQRRSNGLRVKGLLSTGYDGRYGNHYGNNGYAGASAAGDLSFRCNVDYRGAVTNIRIDRNGEYRRY